MSELFVQVDGFDRPVQQCVVELSLKQRSTADIWLIDKESLFNVEIGWSVVVARPGMIFFGGTIDEVTPVWNAGTIGRRWHLRCVSYEQIASRRTITYSTDENVAGSMAAYVGLNFLGAEGISVAEIDGGAGPSVGPFNWAKATVAQALDDIALAAGFYWDITYDKKLRFFDRTTYPAPWNITETSTEIRKLQALEVRYDRQMVANRVHVKIGQYLGDITRQTFVVFDGVTKEFNLFEPVGATPSIGVVYGGVQPPIPQNVGVLGVDLHDWYWQLGSNVITQQSTNPALTPDDVLIIDYRPLSSTTITVDDVANQAERAAIELNTGIYEVVIDAATPSTVQDGTKLGEAYLATHKDDAVILIVDTLLHDLQPGMVINVVLPYLGLGGPSGTNMLIESVTITAGVGQLDNFRASCSTGALLETWQQAFSGAGGGIKAMNLQSGDAPASAVIAYG